MSAIQFFSIVWITYNLLAQKIAVRFQSNFTLKFLLTELWWLSFCTKLFLYLNCKIIKVLYDKVNTINQESFYGHSNRRCYGCLKAFFFKKLFFWVLLPLHEVKLFFFVIVPTPISYLYCFFFYWVSLSLSSYAFQDDVILLQSSWSTGDLQKLKLRYFWIDVRFDAFKSYSTLCIAENVFICSRFVFELMISFIMLQLNNTLEEYTF